MRQIVALCGDGLNSGLNDSPFPRRQILVSSKLKEFADNNFRFDKNGSKFSKLLKTVGKGEIAHYEQFLHFPQCFQDPYCSHVKSGLVWERVKQQSK